MSGYTIDQGLFVREQMDLLAELYAATTAAFLDRIGVASGARCVDLGAGGGHVIMDLARRVGPKGSPWASTSIAR